ncbi:MAG: cytochrome c oxidase assembly protein [Pseudomonadota bacterium]
MSRKETNNSQESVRTSHLVSRLGLVVVGMFAFGFALVPIYDVFCEITGLNGKTAGKATYDAAIVEVEEERLVTVQFTANNNAGMSWQFHPMVNQVQVHPGELTQVKFYARNPTGMTMVAQAVPSVVPFVAADYLHKTECFCFTQQTLTGGEMIEMPLLFYIDKAIPDDVSKLTLSYTLFDVTTNFINSSSNLSAN